MGTKKEKEQKDLLISMILRELNNLQLAQETKSNYHGILDVPLFGVRFKTVPTPHADDSEFHVVHIVEEADVDMEKFFVLLAARGYLHWLRKRVAPEVFLHILMYKNRYQNLTEEAIQRAEEKKESPYVLAYLKRLQDSNFRFLFMQEPEVLDWIIRS